MKLIPTISILAICAAVVVLGAGCREKNKISLNNELYFGEEPVFENSDLIPGNQYIGNNSIAEVEQCAREIADGKQFKFDSAVSFLTNFRTQRILHFRPEDSVKIDSLYGPLAFRVFQYSFLSSYKYTDVCAELNKFNTRINGLGDCTVYEIALELTGPTEFPILPSVYLIFKREPDILRIRCTAFIANKMDWIPVHEGKEVVAVLEHTVYNGRGHKRGTLEVPLRYDRGRFIPVAHFMMREKGDWP